MLKALNSPPGAVVIVFSAVLVLLGHKDCSWNEAKKAMNNPKEFLAILDGYDKDNISDKVIKNLQPIISREDFDPKIVMSKSSAAAGLCDWVLALVQYHKLKKSGATQSPQKAQLTSP